MMAHTILRLTLALHLTDNNIRHYVFFVLVQGLYMYGEKSLNLEGFIGLKTF